MHGGLAIRGQVVASGAKNSALPLMCASILSSGKVRLKGIPDISDVSALQALLNLIGASTTKVKDDLSIDMGDPEKYLNGGDNRTLESLFESLRASVLVAGPLLARFGRARIGTPGGCNIGARPIDIHLEGFSKMGCKVRQSSKWVELEAHGGALRPADIELRFPSVGATENMMMAATLTPGTTVLRNVSREPEVADLASLLREMGSIIQGDGSQTIRVTGVRTLEKNIVHQVIPDRIEIGTYAAIAAATSSELTIRNVTMSHLQSAMAVLERAGVEIEARNGLVRISARALKPVDVKAEPYPGFPTDLQPIFSAMLCNAEGESRIEDTVYSERFGYVAELRKLGAEIEPLGKNGILIRGKCNLKGGTVAAGDLRAGAAMLTAALCAQGTTRIYGFDNIERGYENLLDKLHGIGADVEFHPEI